jgi:hypothetical protein
MPFAAVRKCLEVYFSTKEFTESENCLKFLNFVIETNKANINYSVLHNFITGSTQFLSSLKKHPEVRQQFLSLVELLKNDPELHKLSRLQSYLTISKYINYF